MPKIEKDLLKVKGSDGQWHYVPAVGGSVDTAPTWDAVQNKPFESLGDGLSVDENGVLSVPEGGGGGSADNVRVIDATDDIWKNGEHPLNMTTEEYQNILEWYRNQQSGVAKNILLNIDNRLVFQLVYIDGVGMAFVYSNSGYNRYVKVSRRENEVIATTRDIAGLTKSLMEVSYLCNTGHTDDIVTLFDMTTVGVIRGAGDSVPDNGKSIRYPALVFFGDEISYGNTYATLIDRNGVMWSIYIRLGSGVIELVEKTDYVTNTALTDILQDYVSSLAFRDALQNIGHAIGTKLDKNQGAGNAGKILGVGEDGIVIPQDKPTYTLPQATADALGGVKADAATAEDTQDVRIDADGKLRTKPYTLTDADKTAVAEEVVADGIAATLTDLPSGGGGEKEWTKILETEVTEATATFEVTGLDNYTEFLVINSGLQNATSTDSAQNLYINGVQVFVNFVDVRKSGVTAYNYAIAKFNGIVWECRKPGVAVSETNLTPSTAYIPYNVVFGVGKATSIKMATANPTYAPVSGKITIYGR